MSDFLTILDEHRDLLQERGYDEFGLGSPDKPGLFMQKLEYLFSNCIQESIRDKGNKDFFIEAVGFFDNDNDLVVFNFHYEFNPLNKNIDLKSVSARMDGVKRIMLLDRNSYQLPYAAKVHLALCNERNMKRAKELSNLDNIGKGHRL